MEHVGDDHSYIVNRHNLPDNVPEDMRNSYFRSARYLKTGKCIPEGEMKRNCRKEVLRLAGFSDDEII